MAYASGVTHHEAEAEDRGAHSHDHVHGGRAPRAVHEHYHCHQSDPAADKALNGHSHTKHHQPLPWEGEEAAREQLAQGLIYLPRDSSARQAAE